MDKYTLRQNIADYTCKHFFDGRASLKGKIIKDLAVLDSDTLMDYMVQRLIKESRKEISATLNDNPDQKNQIPKHQPPKVEEPERKLTYAQLITEADLFEVDSDKEAIHEAWLKLSEEDRRRNWEKAIAEHKQRR